MTGLELIVGGWVVPLWVSLPGAIVTGGLAFMIWKEGHCPPNKTQECG